MPKQDWRLECASCGQEMAYEDSQVACPGCGGFLRIKQ